MVPANRENSDQTAQMWSVLGLPCLLMLQGIFSCVIIFVIVYATSDCYMQILVTGVCAIDVCMCGWVGGR